VVHILQAYILGTATRTKNFTRCSTCTEWIK